MDVRLLLLFRMGPRGWSESLCWRGPGPPYDSLWADLAQLVARRRKLLHPDASVQAVRVERIMMTRGSDEPWVPYPVVFWDQFNLDGQAENAATDTWTCVVGTMYPTEGNGWQVIRLHGCPRSFTAYDPLRAAFGAISDAGATFFNLYSAVLLGVDPDYENAGQWCIRRSSRTEPDAERQEVLDVDTGEPPAAQWELWIEDGDAVGRWDTVNVTGMKGCGIKGLVGEHVVDDVDGDTVILEDGKCEPGPVSLSRDGTFYVHIYELAEVGYVYYRRTSERKTGRRFHRYSWAPAKEGLKTGVHPCGIAMDYLRSGYTVNMRTFHGDVPPPCEVDWFRVPDDRPLWLGETPFRSWNWSLFKRNDGIGEQLPWDADCGKVHGPWFTGVEPADFPHTMACGSPAAWNTGAVSGTDPVITIPPDLVPMCCKGPGMTAVIRVGKGWGEEDWASDSGAEFFCGNTTPYDLDMGYILNRYCTLMLLFTVVQGDEGIEPLPPAVSAGWLTLARSHVETEWAAYFYMGQVPADGTPYPTYSPADGTIVAPAAMLSDHKDPITIGNEAWGNEGPGYFASIFPGYAERCVQVYQFVAEAGDPVCPGAGAAYCQLYPSAVKYGLGVMPLPSDATTAWYSLSLWQPAFRGGQFGQLTAGFTMRGPGCEDGQQEGFMRSDL